MPQRGSRECLLGATPTPVSDLQSPPPAPARPSLYRSVPLGRPFFALGQSPNGPGRAQLWPPTRGFRSDASNPRSRPGARPPGPARRPGVAVVAVMGECPGKTATSPSALHSQGTREPLAGRTAAAAPPRPRPRTRSDTPLATPAGPASRPPRPTGALAPTSQPPQQVSRAQAPPSHPRPRVPGVAALLAGLPVRPGRLGGPQPRVPHTRLRPSKARAPSGEASAVAGRAVYFFFCLGSSDCENNEAALCASSAPASFVPPFPPLGFHQPKRKGPQSGALSESTDLTTRPQNPGG